MWRSEINDAVLALVDAKPTEHVVDIGAGMGAGTAVAANTGANVIAVEPTPFLRRVLSIRRLLLRGRSRVIVVDGAAEHLPLPDESIDAAWSVNAMHHWVDPAQAAQELARVVKPGGRVVLVDEDFLDPTHPEHEQFKDQHGGHGHGHSRHDAGHDGHGHGHGHDGHGDGHSDGHSDEHGEDARHHHGFTMVEAEQMGRLLTEAGFAEVTAENRRVSGRPSIAVLGTR
jgi:SAM-dependent methyltransferase